MLQWVTFEISYKKFECAKLKDNCVLKIVDDPSTSSPGSGEFRLSILSQNGDQLLEKTRYMSDTALNKEVVLKQIKKFSEFFSGEESLQERVIGYPA